MTAATQPTWLEALPEIVASIRRLDLKLHNDTHLEPAPGACDDQIHSTLWSRTRLTSRGRLVAELEYSGCIRWWQQWSAQGGAEERPPTAAAVEAGPAPGPAARQ